MSEKDTDSDEMPKLSVEQENEFKKMKLSLENDGMMLGNLKGLPPEIEGKFLDYISEFESKFKNSKQISVYEKIGKPSFILTKDLLENQIEFELESVLELLSKHNIAVNMLYDYENEDLLFYQFITDELFLHEVDDISIEGMITHFTYEDFHPNHKVDLENATKDFLHMFLDKKSTFYKQYHSKDAANHVALNNFRALFSKFKILNYKFLTVEFDEKNAKTAFEIEFCAKIKTTDAKITYSGNASMTFKFEYGYWYVKNVDLPILD